MDSDQLARYILWIWNNSFINDEQIIEFKSEVERDFIFDNLKIFTDLIVITDWYDLGFFKFKPVYLIKVKRLK